MNRFESIPLQKIIRYGCIFCLMLSVLLILNTLLLYINSSIETQYLNSLTLRLSIEPSSAELLKELRNFDLLVHKALFCSPGQIKACLFLFMAGMLVSGISLMAIYSSSLAAHEQPLRHRIKTRIIPISFLVFSITFLSSFISLTYLKKYSVNGGYNAGTIVTNNNLLPLQNQTMPVDSHPIGNKISEDIKSDEKSSVIKKPEPVVPQNKLNPKIEENFVIVKENNNPGLTIRQIKNNHNSFRGPFGNGVSYHTGIPSEWDVSTGKNVLWKAQIPKPGNSSPIVWNDKIFLTGADNEACFLYCLNAVNGNILWTGKVENKFMSTRKVNEDASLADPTATTNGKFIFAIYGTGDIICFDTTGEKKWTTSLGIPELEYSYSSSLIVWEDKLYVQFDTEKGGKLYAFKTTTGEKIWETVRKINLPSWSSPILVQIKGKMQIILTSNPTVAGYDINTGQEIWSVECLTGEVAPSATVWEERVFAGMDYAKLVAIDTERKSLFWENIDYLPEVSSPVAFKELLFVATSYGDLACYNTETGEVIWEKFCNDGFYSSPMIADNKVYAIEKSGVMHVIELAPEIKEINSPELQEKCFATPAFAEGRILIRGKEHLFCFGTKNYTQ